MIRSIAYFSRLVEKYGLTPAEEKLVREALVEAEDEKEFVRLLKKQDVCDYLGNERCTLEELYRDITEESSIEETAGMYAKDRLNRDEVKQIHVTMKPILKKYAKSFALAGSYRRGKSMVGDVDYVVTDANLKNILAMIMLSFKTLNVARQGTSVMTVVIRHGKKEAQVEFVNVKNKQYGAALLHSTGSGEFNQGIRGFAKSKGLILNQHGLFVVTSKELLASKTEEEIFAALGLGMIDPERRDEPFNLLKKEFMQDPTKNVIKSKPKVEGGKTWTVKSKSDPNKKYYVMLNSKEKWSCTCPQFMFRRQDCKHITFIRDKKTT